MAVVLRDCAAADSQSIAIRDAHVAMTWPEVNSLINRVVNALNARDLGPNRRVAVFAENAVETVFAHLGTLHAGGSSVPVNFHLNPDEVAYILKDSDTRLLFTGPENLSRAVDAVALLEQRIPIVCWRIPGEAPAGVESFEAFTAAASEDEPRSDVPPRPNLMYTSGTTGFPKGVELPPTMFAGGKNIEEHVAALKNNRLAALGVHLVVGPMYHTGPLSGVRVLAAHAFEQHRHRLQRTAVGAHHVDGVLVGLAFEIARIAGFEQRGSKPRNQHGHVAQIGPGNEADQ